MRWLIAMVLACAAMPTVAGEAGRADLRLDLPPPADTGKAALPSPGIRGDTQEGCAPALPCGTRLLGTVRKNGAVELQVPAWRW